MNKLKDFLLNNETRIALVIGYLIVSGLAFGLGHYTAPKTNLTSSNYNPNIAGSQTKIETDSTDVCAGKIKGSASLIYHIPGGAFYEKTSKPIRCFDTEAEAKAAGFRKSSR